MRAVACVIAGLAVAGWAFTGRGASTETDSGRQPEAVPPVPYGAGLSKGLAGAGTSCAAASCHGGAVGTVGGEHTTWTPAGTAAESAGDPHANGYRVLFNDVSVRMAKLLPDLKDRDGKPTHKAHEAALCLKCHAVPNLAPDAEGRPSAAVAEGVGCSGCHGPSEKWVAEHYLPQWKAMSNRDKWEHYGFVPTKNLVARTLICAGCHVGDGDRDMNHDLIAAGHPRLAFESARFHYQPEYRKHWTEPGRDGDFEVRAWVVGQAASLRAALALLQARAERSLKNEAPWPELSEGSCFACHQNVARDPYPETTKDPLRGTQGGRTRPAGTIPWQPWYTSVGVAAPLYHGVLFGTSVERGPVGLTELRAEMEKRSPDAREVARLAGQAVRRLDAMLAEWQAAEDRGVLPTVTGPVVGELGRRLVVGAVSDSGELADYDWDFVAQRYLGLAALYHASGGSAGPAAGWREPLLGLRASLAYPPAAADPLTGLPVRYNNPVKYRPTDAAKQLDELRKTFPNARSGR